MGNVGRPRQAEDGDTGQDMRRGHEAGAERSFVPAARNEPVGKPAQQQRRRRLDEVDHRQQAGHLDHLEPARLDEEQRQPGEEEEEGIGVGEMTDAHRPDRALLHHPADRDRGRGGGALAPMGFGDDQPWDQPQEGDEAEGEEDHSPSIMDHDQSADEDAERGAEVERRGNRAVGDAAMLAGDPRGDDLRRGGEGDALADAEHDPKRDQRGEASRETGQCGGERPQHETRGDEAIDAEAVGQPADDQLGGGVDPGEG